MKILKTIQQAKNEHLPYITITINNVCTETGYATEHFSYLLTPG